jgi:hypothetical protein
MYRGVGGVQFLPFFASALVGVEWLFHAGNFTHCNNAVAHSVGGSVNSRAGVDGSGEGKNVLPFP